MGFASLWHARTCFEDFWHISQHVMASAPLLHRHSQASLRGVGNLFLFWPGALMSIKHHHYTGLPVGAAWETLRHGLTFWFRLVHLKPKTESNTKHVPKAEIASQLLRRIIRLELTTPKKEYSMDMLSQTGVWVGLRTNFKWHSSVCFLLISASKPACVYCVLEESTQ